MNMTDILKPIRTGASNSALCACSPRLVAARLKSVLPRRIFTVYPSPRPAAESLGKRSSSSRAGPLAAACIVAAFSAAPNAQADIYLWFHDTEDGSAVEASGSFDLSEYLWSGGGNTQNLVALRNTATYGRFWGVATKGGITRYEKDNLIVQITGEDSYTGTRDPVFNQGSSVGDFRISSDRNNDIAFSDNFVNNNMASIPDGTRVTFTKSLMDLVGDDDFHVEFLYGTQKLVFATVSSPPAKPEDLTATPDDGQLTLSWTDPKDTSISSYEIQQKSEYGDYSDWEPIEGSGRATTSHTIDGLKNGERYSFRIRAVNLHGAGAQSDEVTAAPVKPGAPAAAELSAVSTEEVGQVVLSWTLADDASITEWQLQQRQGDAAFGDEWTAIEPSNAATRSHTIDGLSGEVTYGFRVRAVNGNGNGVASRMATATPKAPEPEPEPMEPEPMEPEPTGPTVEMEKQALKKSLAAEGQARLAGVTNVIDQRLQSTPVTSALVLGGQTLAATGSSMNPATSQETDGWWSGSQNPESFNRSVGDADLLDGSAFTLSLSEEDGSDRGWTIWGHGDLQRFEGNTGEDSWDGSVKSAVLGFDTRTNGNLLAGLAVSSHRGNIDLVTDDVGSRTETSLTAAWPYMQMAMPSGAGTVRVVLGVGSGDAEHHSDDGDVERAGLSMTTASVGARWAVAQQGQVTLSVPVKAEVVQLKTDGDGTTAIGGLSIKSWRASGGLKAAHSGVALDAGWVLIPRGSVSFRWDGGDGVTGKGIEVGGGFGLHAPDSRLSLDASGRWLATHSDDNQREWGASIGVQIAPDSQGRGWSASLRQEWGLQQEDALSDDTLFESSTGGPASTLGSLAARAGYGFGMMEGLMTVSADARLATGDEEVPHYGAGMEFALPGGLSASLRGEHVHAVDPDTRIGAGVHLRF